MVKKQINKMVLTCGILGLMIFTGVGNTVAQPLQPMVTYASEQNQSLPYSSRWEIMSNGDWKYKMDNGQYATGKWLQDEVDKNWYLMNENGIMRSGIFKSYDRYYLLSEIHDGHFGHLVKNGEVYHGITIKADTSSTYEGALSQESINALKAIGYNFNTVKDVSGTSHVSDGKVTHEATTNTQQNVNTSISNKNNNVKKEESQAQNKNNISENGSGYYSEIFGWVDTSDIIHDSGKQTGTKWN